MIRRSMTLGAISGIPIKIQLNWFLIAIVVTWSLAGGYFPQKNPGWGTAHYWALGAITALLFFSSVLFHELGHALVALKEGVPVKSITLFIFGGVAHIAHEPETAESEFRIVAAGPGASLVLAAFYHALSAVPGLSPDLHTACLYLSQINIILALFNLIPGFPLDGGRLLRATLWKLSQDFKRATRWATTSGLVIAGLFIAMGLAFVMMDNLFNGLWLAFIGWYLGRAAIQQSRQSLAQDHRTYARIRLKLNWPSAMPGKAGSPAYGFGPALILVDPQKPVEKKEDFEDAA